MYFKVKSSRDTAAGLFRAGVVYKVAKNDRKTLTAIKPHLEKGTFVELDAKAAKAEAAGSLVKLAPAKVDEKKAKAAAKAGKEAENAAVTEAAEKAAAAQAVTDAEVALTALSEGEDGYAEAVEALDAAKAALAEYA